MRLLLTEALAIETPSGSEGPGIRGPEADSPLNSNCCCTLET